MRVLFLASYFPRPTKPLIGTWALEQARALAQACDLRVVCCTPYVPRFFSCVPRAKPWVDVPREYVWPSPEGHAGQKGVRVSYLKGLFYPFSPLNRWAFTHPEPQMTLVWKSIRHKLLHIVDEFQPQVIFAHHTVINGFFAEKIHRLRGLPFVITDHDFGEVALCAKYSHRRAMFDRIKRAAFTNICVARRMEEDTRRIFPDASTVTLHNGVNPSPTPVLDMPRPVGLRGKKVILSVGMFTERKAMPLLIEAFKAVADNHPHAVLRIIGDGVERPSVESAIHRHGLQDKVTLLGLCSPRQVFQEMAWSDIFALLGWNEPFATVFIEAMSAGLPIIAASDGGITDVIKHGVHGLTVPPRNVAAAAAAMSALLADDERRRAMGRQGRALVASRLTWSANVKQLVALFQEALHTRTIRPATVPLNGSDAGVLTGAL